MKKDVLISIRGTQNVDGEKDVVELLTMGRFYKRKGIYYITYNESEATGFEGSKTMVKVDERVVTMRRFGDTQSQLVVEKGVRHQCHYDMGVGSLTVGVSGDQIVSTLGEHGGELLFRYSLDVNTSLTSENEVYINIRECGN